MSKIKKGIVRLALGASILLTVTGSAFASSVNVPPNPPGPYRGNLTFKSDFSLGSYFTAVFGNPAIPPGFDIVQGATYKAWCVEFNDDIAFSGGPITFTATNVGPFTFRDSTGTLPLNAQSPHWGAVNWLLNNKGGNTVVDIQEAIWFLLNGGYHSNPFIFAVESSVPSAATVALVNAALTHTSFVPVAGQVVAVLADGGDGLENINGGPSDVQSLIIEVTVPPQGTGCPATQGFWHKASRWPNVSKAVDGVIYNGATKSMTIGGITYSQGQLLALLPSGSLHTGGYVNALSQFIAAVLNLVSGAQHAGIDTTIATINTDLTGVTFVSGTGTAADPYVLVPISQSLQTTLEGFENTLDNYNSAVGLGCTEASGLTVGN